MPADNDAPSTMIPRAQPAEAAKRAVEDMAAAGDTGLVKADDPKGAELYDFVVTVKGGDARALTGKFKNRILSLNDRVSVGLIASQMVRGIAMSVLDADTVWLVQSLAHLSLSLVEKPEWYANMIAEKEGSTKNIRVIEKVYAEVASHEQFFRGSDAAQAQGSPRS